MSRGEAYRHIRLLDAAGKPVADPFLELDEELWSADGKRFTLLFDPGRIKRGLEAARGARAGPGGGQVLRAGRRPRLARRGRPTRSRAEFRKAFRAGPPDDTSPDPKTWTVHPPAAGTRDPLAIPFPEPLDRALLDRLIAVRDGPRAHRTGRGRRRRRGNAWRFVPDAPGWRGEYRARHRQGP